MAGQLSIDGLELRHKAAAIQGQIDIPADLLPEMMGGKHVRIVITARVSSKTARFRRGDDGDDYAEGTIGLGIVETRSVKLVTIDGQEPASAGAPDAPDEKPKRGRKLSSVPPVDPAEPPVE